MYVKKSVLLLRLVYTSLPCLPLHRRLVHISISSAYQFSAVQTTLVKLASSIVEMSVFFPGEYSRIFTGKILASCHTAPFPVCCCSSSPTNRQIYEAWFHNHWKTIFLQYLDEQISFPLPIADPFACWIGRTIALDSNWTNTSIDSTDEWWMQWLKYQTFSYTT